MVTTATVSGLNPESKISIEDQVRIRDSNHRLANDLAERCEGRLCHVGETRKWLFWDGNGWRPKPPISEAMRDLLGRFCGPPLSVLRKVRYDKRVLVSICRLDAEPDLLGTPKGVVDLRTSAVLTPSPEMFITRSTAVTPVRGTCPRWYRFLHEQTGGDVDLQGYIQRMAGYCLTGHTSERATFLLLGPDGGGKDVFLKIMQAAFGTYAQAVEKGSIGLGRLDWTLAGLVGSRLVRMPEFRRGNRWRAQAFMTLGGDAPVAARFRFQRHVIYKPSFKLLFSGTFRPSIAQDDQDGQQRIQIIPFTQQLREKTLTLADEIIRTELPEILAWMIDGAVAWYRGGLRPPQCVLGLPGETERRAA